MIQEGDIESIERATFDAVPPEAMDALDGWLMGLDHGTVGRAHSAVPLHHGGGARTDEQVIEPIEARYATHGLRTVFRLPQLPAFDAVRAGLQRRGYVASKSTSAWTGSVDAMRSISEGEGAQLLAAPDDAWRAVFLGEGFDPVDGASRVRILGRAKAASFARVRVDGTTAAAGMGSFSQGWASVHGMRTLAPYRGRGLASSILGVLAREAQARSISRVFLQVEDSSTGAQALYRRAGFAPAWSYVYWSQL